MHSPPKGKANPVRSANSGAIEAIFALDFTARAYIVGAQSKFDEEQDVVSNRKVGRAVVAGLATIAAVYTAPAMAEDEKSDISYLAALKACQQEQVPAARLACFDAAAATIVNASEAGDLRIVDREEVRKTRRGLFGFSIPDFGIFGKRDKDGEDQDKIEEIETKIASVTGSHEAGYVIRTTEGAVWQIDSVPRRLLDPKVGDTVLIKNAALTSYFLRINGQGGVRGTRIR
jgi:hypothetical protein